MSKIIVIDREYSSGGRKIGEILSKELNIPLYDENLLIKEAERSGFNLSTLTYYDEKPASPIMDSFIVASAGMNLKDIDPTYEIFSLTEKVITESADEGSCIFIGRCADHILKDTDHDIINVFIYASSLEAKISKAIEVDGVSPVQAKGVIAKKDKQRSRYYQSFTGGDWGNKHNYDMCLDSSKFGIDGCAKIIQAVYLNK